MRKMHFLALAATALAASLSACASGPDYYDGLDLLYPSDEFVRASVRTVSSMMDDQQSLTLVRAGQDADGSSTLFNAESAELAKLETGGGSILLATHTWTHDPGGENWVDLQVSNFHPKPDQPPYTDPIIAIEDGKCLSTDLLYNERSLCSALSPSEWRAFAEKALAYSKTRAGFQ